MKAILKKKNFACGFGHNNIVKLHISGQCNHGIISTWLLPWTQKSSQNSQNHKEELQSVIYQKISFIGAKVIKLHCITFNVGINCVKLAAACCLMHFQRKIILCACTVGNLKMYFLNTKSYLDFASVHIRSHLRKLKLMVYH